MRSGATRNYKQMKKEKWKCWRANTNALANNLVVLLVKLVIFETNVTRCNVLLQKVE